MRKLLSLFSSFTIISTCSTNVIGCGAEDGPEVDVYLASAKSSLEWNVNKTYNEFPDYNKSYKEYPARFEGYITSFVWPTLVVTNLKSDAKGTGPKFKQGLYDKSLEGQKSTLEKSNPLWKDFYNIWSSAKDSYFSKIILNKSGTIRDRGKLGVPTNWTYVGNKAQLTVVPYISNIKKKAYWIHDKSKMNPISNLITFKNIGTGLTKLNKNTELQNQVLFGSDFSSKKDYYALISLPDIEYQLSLSYKDNSGSSETFTFAVITANVVARVEYTSFNISDSKEKTWYWLLNGYDYYSNSSLNKMKHQTENWIYGDTSEPANQSGVKSGISFPDLDFKIESNTIHKT